METDKRSFYAWIMVLIFVVGVTSISYSFDLVGNLGIPLVISLFLSAIPVLISQSNSKYKNRFVYGAKFLLLLLVLYSVLDYFTCTGKFCQVDSVMLGFGSGFSAIIFAFFSAIGVKKFSTGAYLYMICTELILLIGVGLSFR